MLKLNYSLLCNWFCTYNFFFSLIGAFDSFEPSGNKQLTAYCSNTRNPQGARLYILKADKIIQLQATGLYSTIYRAIYRGREGKEEKELVNDFRKDRYLEFIVNVLIWEVRRCDRKRVRNVNSVT